MLIIALGEFESLCEPEPEERVYIKYLWIFQTFLECLHVLHVYEQKLINMK